jgi:hypothetical protein
VAAEEGRYAHPTSEPSFIQASGRAELEEVLDVLCSIVDRVRETGSIEDRRWLQLKAVGRQIHDADGAAQPVIGAELMISKRGSARPTPSAG